jgi:hypothetical protein
MANIASLIVRIGAQDTEIQKALESVGVKAKSVNADLSKLGNTPLAAQAKASLDEFNKTLKTITDNQQRVADRSKLAAQGLTALGGPARLTKTELDALAKTVNNGLDAFRALGQKAPDELKKVAAAISDQQKVLSGGGGGFIQNLLGDTGSEVAKIAGGFATGTFVVQTFEKAVGAAIGTVKDAIATAAHLQDLSTSTKISTDNLQALGFAGKRVGLDLDSIVNTIDQLAKRVGNNDQGATRAIQSLGLNFDELKKLSPEDLFEKVGLAAASVENPIQRDAIAAELFGKQFEGALRIATDGLANARAEAAKNGAILGPDQIKTLDDFGDHVGDLTARFKVLAAEALTPVVGFLDKILLAGKELAQQKPIKFIDPAQQALFERQLALQEQIERRRQDQEKQQAAKNPGKPLGVDLSGFGQGLSVSGAAAAQLKAGNGFISDAQLIQNRLDALRKNALEPLTAAQKANIESLNKWGDDEKDIANLVGASQEAVHLYIEQIKKAETEQKKFDEAAKDVKSGIGGLGETLKNIDPLTQAFARSLLDAGVSESSIATFFGLTRTEMNAIKTVRENDIKLVQLQAGSNEDLASALDKVGKKDVETITHLKQKLDLTDQLNKIQNGQKIGQIDVSQLPGDKTNEVGALEEREKKLAERAKEVDAALQAIVEDFAALGQIGGPIVGDLVRGFGAAIAAAKTLKDSIHAFETSKTDFGKVAGAAGAVGAVIQIGTAIAGAVKAALEHLELSRIAHDVGRDFGVAISEGTQQGIRDSENQLANSARLQAENLGIPKKVAEQFFQAKAFREAAEALNLPQIINDAGGIEAFGTDKAVSKLHDLFSLVEQGKLTVGQIGKEFDDIFSQLVPNAISKTSKLASAAFVELEQTAIRFKTNSPALEQFRSQQTTGVQSALASFFGDKDTAGQAKVQSQAAATAFGNAIAAEFTELQRQGLPLLDILKQFGPTIEAFRKQLLATGFDGGAAFDGILKDADLLKDKLAGPALQSVQSIQQILAGLANVGGLDAETFSGLADQVGRTFKQLEAQGKDSNEILKLMAPTLQTIFELQERTGFAVDETTANLIAQAKAQGLVGDQFKSSGERTVDSLDRISVILAALAEKFGVQLPKAVKDAVDKINKDLANIKDNVNVNVNIHTRTQPVPDHKDQPGGPILDVATGGRVLFGAVQRFSAGGRVLPFRSVGTDTVPAMLTPNEIVLNAAQQKNIGDVLSNLGGTVINFTVHATDADSVRRALPEFSKLLREYIHQGGREQTAWRGALKVSA